MHSTEKQQKPKNKKVKKKNSYNNEIFKNKV